MQAQNSCTDGVGAAAVTNAETVSQTLANGISVNPGVQVVVEGIVDLTAGTSTTAVVLRVRRGTTTGGAQVGRSITHTLAAGASASIPFQFTDVPGEVAGQQYVVTIQQTAGAANSTPISASIQASWIQ